MLKQKFQDEILIMHSNNVRICHRCASPPANFFVGHHVRILVYSLMEISYTPVQYVYKEVIEEEISKQTTGKIFYFDHNDAVESAEGRIRSMEEVRGKGLFILMEPDMRIRVDRIITVFGKPGAAFDQYDAYANACLSCTGGDLD